MKIMAVDYGEARTGIAVSDVLEMLARPVEVIKETNTTKAIDKIANSAVVNEAEMVIVGHPLNMDGSAGERAQKCRFVAEQLRERVDIPVELWDERATTKTAHSILNDNNTYGKKRKQVLDAVAATVILESYLAFRKNLNK